jgi:hypothetical protein
MNRQGTATLSVGQCTTCHMQQQSDGGTLPWNYALRPTSYQWSDPRTTAGTPYPMFQGDTYKGPTTKCLSCHDGLLSPIDGWYGGGTSYGAGHAVSRGGNLSETHPVALPYPVNGSPSTYNYVRSGLYLAPTEWVADPMATNGIRLFNDDAAGNIVVGVAAGRTGIECSSCHDVHNGPRAKDQMFAGRSAGRQRSHPRRLYLRAVPPQVDQPTPRSPTERAPHSRSQLAQPPQLRLIPLQSRAWRCARRDRAIEHLQRLFQDCLGPVDVFEPVRGRRRCE